MNATAKTARPLRVLVVDDSQDDALLLLRTLGKIGFATEWARVDSATAMQAAFSGGGWDLVVSDYNIPGFGALEALEIARRHDPELPFFVVSGSMDDKVVAHLRRAGAQDCLLKHELSRLAPAIARGLRAAGPP